MKKHSNPMLDVGDEIWELHSGIHVVIKRETGTEVLSLLAGEDQFRQALSKAGIRVGNHHSYERSE